MKTHSTARVIGLLLLVASLAACGAPVAQPTLEAPAAPSVVAQPPTAAPVAEPRVLKLRLMNDVSNLDPAFRPSSAEGQILLTVLEGLVAYKPGTSEVVNVLAESITPSADGLRVDFKLKEGIQFQAGCGELTAQDVKFSFERYIDPALDSPEKVNWQELDRVDVTGTYTGTIVLKNPFPPLWTNTLPDIDGTILCKKYGEMNGAEAYAKTPVGTGPYEFVEWVPDQYVLLKPFAGYWGEKPVWDEIRLIPVVDDSAAQIALETGELDFASMPEALIGQFEGKAGFQVVKITPFSYDVLLMNVQHPKLADINVREAIRAAVDVPSILEAAYGGKATRACALLAPGQLGYWADAPCPARDVTQAKAFLAKAGLTTLDITLTTLSAQQDRQIAEMIQANLAEAGITAEIVAQDDATYWDGGFGEQGLKDRELTLIRWSTTGPDPSYNTSWFTCDQVLQWNWAYWCSPGYDELHYRALKTVDAAARQQMYIDLQKVWDEAANAVWIAHPASYFVVRQGVQASLTALAMPIPWAFSGD